MAVINEIKKKLSGREIGFTAEGVVRHFSILVPFVLKDGEYYLLFEERSKNISQSSDICFPGGRVEINESYEYAAIRETHEELLIDMEDVEILGPLDLYIAHDNIIVHPFLGILHNYEETFFEDEVANIHYVSLTELLNHEPDVYGGKLTLQLDENFPYSRIAGGRNYAWREGSRKLLFYNFDDLTIWGMTAMILRNALNLIKSI